MAGRPARLKSSQHTLWHFIASSDQVTLFRVPLLAGHPSVDAYAVKSSVPQLNAMYLSTQAAVDRNVELYESCTEDTGVLASCFTSCPLLTPISSYVGGIKRALRPTDPAAFQYWPANIPASFTMINQSSG